MMYRNLALMTIVHFLIMYAVMYATVNAFANVFLNVSRVYMAGLMTLPMVILELLFMRTMYKNKAINASIALLSVVGMILFFLFIRQQTLVGNEQFVRAMIPHHAGAILMCERSAITDPEIKDLCNSIIESQQREISQMKDILRRLSQQ